MLVIMPIDLYLSLQASAVVNSGLLLMAVLGLMFPAVLHFTHSEAQYGKSEVALSRFSSCIMLVAYASYLFFQLKSHRSMYCPIGDVSSFSLSSCKHHKLKKKKEMRA